MPLSRAFYEPYRYIVSHGLISLADILMSDFTEPMFRYRSTSVQRMIFTYPIELKEYRSKLIRNIMEAIWDKPYTASLLNRLDEFEKFLLAVGKREHFVHQFEVMLLGLNFLKLINDQGVIGDLKKVFLFDDWKDIFQTWTLTAIGHDFGYPFEIANEMIGKIATLYAGLRMKRVGGRVSRIHIPMLHDEEKLCMIPAANVTERNVKEHFDVLNFVRKQIQHELSTTFDKVLKLEEDLGGEEKRIIDHGYVSALMLTSLTLEGFRDSEDFDNWSSFHDRKERIILNKSVGAIALHNLENKYTKNIDFNRNIYAYMLYFFDNIHDWGRQIYPNEKWPTYHLSRFQLEDHTMYIDIYLYHRSWDEEIIARTKDVLNGKKRVLNRPKKPKPSMDINVIIKYWSDSPEIKEKEIKIEL